MPILFLVLPVSPLATPMAFLAKAKNYVANTQTNVEKYYIDVTTEASTILINALVTSALDNLNVLLFKILLTTYKVLNGRAPKYIRDTLIYN